MTGRIPKPLIPFFDVSLLELAVRRLVDAGVSQIVVNVFHLAGQMERALDELVGRLTSEGHAVTLHVSRESELMGTGGGIALARPHFDGLPLLVVNSDVLFDFELPRFVEFHRLHGGEASVLVRDGGDFPALRSTRLDENGRVVEIGKEGSAEGTGVFAGIYLLEPASYRKLPCSPCSVVDALLRPAIAKDKGIFGLSARFPWFDLGTWQRYREAGMAVLDRVLDAGVRKLTPGRFCASGYVGPGATIPDGADIRHSILQTGSSCTSATDSVLLPRAHVTRDIVSCVAAPECHACP